MSGKIRDPIFTVIDSATGKEPDLEKIACTEKWAEGLLWCDMDGWAIDQSGLLFLMDECGQYRYPPEHRYQIQFTFAFLDLSKPD